MQGYQKIGSALFYAASSVLIMTVNKSVLTTEGFPSAYILALGQVCSTIVILGCLKLMGVLHFPDLSMDTISRIFPLPLFYSGNLIFSLLGTQGLSLPMMTALRRFSILLTMVLERLILGKSHEGPIVVSVFVMLFGSIVAASTDLMFSLIGYTFVMMNNICTATQGVYMKKKLDAKELGKFGILYYNCLIMMIPTYFMAQFAPNDSWGKAIYEFDGWNRGMFIVKFTTSCVMGLVLNFSIVLCTYHNSALTTTVIGCLKNVLITYYGVLFPTIDYVFNIYNFTGLTISIVGSIGFSYYSFVIKNRNANYQKLQNVVTEDRRGSVKSENEK